MDNILKQHEQKAEKAAIARMTQRNVQAAGGVKPYIEQRKAEAQAIAAANAIEPIRLHPQEIRLIDQKGDGTDEYMFLAGALIGKSDEQSKGCAVALGTQLRRQQAALRQGRL